MVGCCRTRVARPRSQVMAHQVAHFEKEEALFTCSIGASGDRLDLGVPTLTCAKIHRETDDNERMVSSAAVPLKSLCAHVPVICRRICAHAVPRPLNSCLQLTHNWRAG